jgi:signal transduction histidine kinase
MLQLRYRDPTATGPERQRRRAEEASRSKSQFLAGVAHDRKRPVAVIKSYADLLMQNPQGEGSGHARLLHCWPDPSGR